MATVSDVKAVFAQADSDKLKMESVLDELEDETGSGESELKQLVFRATQNVGIDPESGSAMIELREDVDVEAANESAQGGAPVGSGDSDEEVVADVAAQSGRSGGGDISGGHSSWDAGGEKVEIGKIDQETGKPTGETYHHIDVREDVSHPLVPDVPAYIAQDFSESVTDVEAFTFFAEDSDFGVQLIGEPGTGKGHLVKSVAENANIPLVRVNMGMGMTRSKLVGRFVPRNGDSGITDQLNEAKSLADDEEISVEKALEILNIREKFEWRDGLLTSAVKNGFWFLADELNAADAELLLPFNGLLEDEDSRSLEITEKSQKIEPHPGFKLVATRNPTHHRGTKKMNHAFVDRLYPMRVDYLPPKQEATLLADQEEVSIDEARDLVEFAQSIRNAYPVEISHKTLTYRGLQRIARRSRVFGLRESARQEMIEDFDEFHSEGKESGDAVIDRLNQVFDS